MSKSFNRKKAIALAEETKKVQRGLVKLWERYSPQAPPVVPSLLFTSLSMFTFSAVVLNAHGIFSDP